VAGGNRDRDTILEQSDVAYLPAGAVGDRLKKVDGCGCG
jgi:hypothetical protein